MKAIDVTGQKFHGLRVVRPAGIGRWQQRLWLCVCDCGNETVTTCGMLRNGNTKSCGCLKRGPHGKSNTRVHNCWTSMLQRCNNPRNPAYKWYGARGIQVCERWHSFENFYADMGDQPEGLSIDRINNDGNYEPTNCRWATTSEQLSNRRKRTHCKHGHEWTPENTRRSSTGHRRCAPCRAARHQARRKAIINL